MENWELLPLHSLLLIYIHLLLLLFLSLNVSASTRLWLVIILTTVKFNSITPVTPVDWVVCIVTPYTCDVIIASLQGACSNFKAFGLVVNWSHSNLKRRWDSKSSLIFLRGLELVALIRCQLCCTFPWLFINEQVNDCTNYLLHAAVLCCHKGVVSVTCHHTCSSWGRISPALKCCRDQEGAWNASNAPQCHRLPPASDVTSDVTEALYFQSPSCLLWAAGPFGVVVRKVSLL